MKFRRLPGTVYALGLVSLLNDISTEMIYPLLPVFLTGVIGATASQLGLIEGLAETTASLVKLLSGVWADRVRRRKPLVLAGYGLSSALRPAIGLAQTWGAVGALRFVDRIGKGIRTSPRDALIGDAIEPARRGEAFGFHQSMDHAGAVVGPLIAGALLSWFGIPLRTVFLLSAIPAAFAMAAILIGVKEKLAPSTRAEISSGRERVSGGSKLAIPAGPFRLFLFALLIFTLGNSTDAFLLMRLSHAGLHPGAIAGLWSVHHIVKMGSSLWGGSLSDRIGRKPAILAGWLAYALVYLGFAVVGSEAGLIALFLAYGVYYGMTEASQKAWVTDLVPADRRGGAFGFYNLAIGIGALPASLVFGFLADRFGSAAAFGTGAGLALLASAILAMVPGRV